MFQHFGYKQIFEKELPDYIDIIALYTIGPLPTHAARKIDGNFWTSKLGDEIDLSHTLEGLVSSEYGNPSHYFSK